MNYSGNDPIADGLISFAENRGSTIVYFDQDGLAGNSFIPRPFILVQGVSANDVNNSNNFVFN